MNLTDNAEGKDYLHKCDSMSDMDDVSFHSECASITNLSLDPKFYQNNKRS